ncbi:conserved protein of unknown function [Magnetospirillum gryphiswaldense MSR-1 v2]|uniref:Uncharacterized protein n=1 Tax=Magnetospirillum gryphiswaldense (strain DSM 6361 / JCM 21280 / NBRC 15271 / MSR-1) TaxID=431944 RepID=V6F8T3_MAGGM|nr:hypothetical protein [Magnetospirillum gryphiswaldense]CDL01228.1 conserved protein of unknown function [Magnetospirillum gryphiswaldense MSR-1 v2]
MTASSPVHQALQEALEAAYLARATSAAVIDRFGPVRPFVSVIQWEQRQINGLQNLLRQRGWPVAVDRHGGRVVAPPCPDQAWLARQGNWICGEDQLDRLRRMAAEDAEVVTALKGLGQPPAFTAGDGNAATA